MVPSRPVRRLGASSSMNSDRKAMVVRARMVENTALARLVPTRQGRLAEVVGRRLQLGGVLLDPGEQVEPLEGVGQPAVAPLDLVDHGGQALGHVGQGVDQRVAEQGRAGRRRRATAPAKTTPDGRAPPEPVALQEVDGRVEHQGDEGGDEDPQDHLAEPAEQPVEHPGGDDHRVDGQDGPERDPLGRGRGEQPLPPRERPVPPPGPGARPGSR